MNTVQNIILAAAIAALLAAGGALLDGPDAEQIERATAADLADAKLAAQRFDRDLRACRRAMGPDADLVEIARSGDFVCRAPAKLSHD